MKKFLSKIFDFNAQELKKLQKIADQVERFAPEMARLTDEELAAKTPYFRQLLEAGKTLDDILPEAFAVAREAADRVLGMRPFPVQVLGAVVLHQGRVAEMKTGEGKTLVATMPAYLNALSGNGVHVVTVNDYLAQRDSEWMGQVYKFLGLEVGLILAEMPPHLRREAYNADITYGTNNEFGFDYLRDNMSFTADTLVQRELNYAIIDEVDSILIDEARTPLIISGPDEISKSEYHRFTQIARRLRRDRDYTLDEKARTLALTAEGIAAVERALNIENLYDPEQIEASHRINNAIRAEEFMKRDRDYIVKDDEVIIVDNFTGRLMIGRRYSDGLHQAIEAKENVTVADETKTYATITLQNYFRLYNKIAGMTGTAKTEEDELSHIYGMDVVEVPTNKPMIREDLPDRIYKDMETKYKAVIASITERHAKGQPLLVGTVSIEVSELLSAMLKKQRIPHNVLNAKYHEQEAAIIKDAGQLNAVTIATNMAGRGTDIVLGPGVREIGGLHVIGTERHESRRIDNQLRGRSGRQGDPGSSQFFVSLEDDLMRLFSTDLAAGLMDRLGLDETEALEHPLLDRALERAQTSVEGNHFAMRKHILEYDDVLNKQREVIYAERRKVLDNRPLRDDILSMGKSVLEAIVLANFTGSEYDMATLEKQLLDLVPSWQLHTGDWQKYQPAELSGRLYQDFVEQYMDRIDSFEELADKVEQWVLLRVVDRHWMEHLDAMYKLRQGIGLRAYGGGNPLLDYQNESYEEFQNMIHSIKEETIKNIFRVRVNRSPEEQLQREAKSRQLTTNQVKEKSRPVTGKKIGRNDPCPCGSGKKYKHCCGR